ncbi:MAG TPA: hypothetical protein VM925_23680 [Labilithrix sp.]|nr:hypothetical protein [Labilithrix sp.]
MPLERADLLCVASDPEESTLVRALRLAREVEELLEETSSVVSGRAANGAHSTRIVRAMAASLVDELDGLARGTHEGGAA